MCGYLICLSFSTYSIWLQVNWYSSLSIYFLHTSGSCFLYLVNVFIYSLWNVCFIFYLLLYKSQNDIWYSIHQYKYMSIIIFYQNTSTMLYSTIPKSSPSQRLSHLSPGQSFPHLPVNFLLGARGPCHWSFGHCNLTIDCIGCIECRLLLLYCHFVDFILSSSLVCPFLPLLGLGYYKACSFGVVY